MKKLRLRGWVKVALVGVVVLTILSNIHYESAVDKCVNAGNSQTYCENGLR